VVGRLRLGAHAERLLWVLHRRALEARSSVLRLPDHLLGEGVWGPRTCWPRHWRQDLLGILQGLSWLHLAAWNEGGRPSLGADTALLHHVADLRGQSLDRCGEDCPGLGGPAHHHVLVNVARGFLGSLEQFALPEDGSGVRTYAFPVAGRRNLRATLRRVGR